MVLVDAGGGGVVLHLSAIYANDVPVGSDAEAVF
jgi:hypothetical protein